MLRLLVGICVLSVLVMLAIGTFMLLGGGCRVWRGTFPPLSIREVSVTFEPKPESMRWISDAEEDVHEVIARYKGARHVMVRIERGGLYVNETYFGSIDKGDKIVIFEDVISVNGEVVGSVLQDKEKGA